MNDSEILAELREHLAYDPATGDLIWLKHRWASRVGTRCGTLHRLGYVVFSFKGVQYYNHRVAFALYHGVFPPGYLDHANRDRSDNRICNLREADPSQNSQNGPVRVSNTSGFHGVSRHKPTNSWQAQVRNRGRMHSKIFKTPEEAAKWAEAKRKELHGDFALLNQSAARGGWASILRWL